MNYVGIIIIEELKYIILHTIHCKIQNQSDRSFGEKWSDKILFCVSTWFNISSNTGHVSMIGTDTLHRATYLWWCTLLLLSWSPYQNSINKKKVRSTLLLVMIKHKGFYFTMTTVTPSLQLFYVVVIIHMFSVLWCALFVFLVELITFCSFVFMPAESKNGCSSLILMTIIIPTHIYNSIIIPIHGRFSIILL